MARRATSRRTARNLFGLGGRRKVTTTPRKCTKHSSLTIGAALQAAYDAGHRSPDTGLFDEWVCAKGLDSRGDQLTRRLRTMYENGFEDRVSKEEKAYKDKRATKATAKPAADASTGWHIGDRTRYKGVDIIAVPDGEYTISSDRQSRFETVKDAKAVIDHMARNPRQPWTLSKAARYYYVHGLHGAKTPTLAGQYWTKPEATRAAQQLADEEGETIRVSGSPGVVGFEVQPRAGRRNPAPTLTRKLAWAAATDAGNRAMRKGGRTAWNEDDYATAAQEFARLWPEDSRANPHTDLGTKLADELAGDAEDVVAGVMDSEVPVFEGPVGGYPGVRPIMTYPAIEAALAYCHGVKPVYGDVCVVHHRKTEHDVAGVYCVVIDADEVRAAEGVAVADAMDLVADTVEATTGRNPRRLKRGGGGHAVFEPLASGTSVVVNDSQRLNAAATVLDWNGDAPDAWGEHHAARLRMSRLGNEILAPHYTITAVATAARNPGNLDEDLAARYQGKLRVLEAAGRGQDTEARHLRAMLRFYEQNDRLPSMADSEPSPVGRNPSPYPYKGTLFAPGKGGRSPSRIDGAEFHTQEELDRWVAWTVGTKGAIRGKWFVETDTPAGHTRFEAGKRSNPVHGFGSPAIRRRADLVAQIDRINEQIAHTTSPKKLMALIKRRSAVSAKAMDRDAGASGRKRNGLFAPTAEDGYEDFHGRPATGEVEISTPIVDPGKLYELGSMVSIRVETLSGYEAEVGFETDPPMLCANKAGNQLYFESGNQKLDLNAIHMAGKEWVRDVMTIGNLVETTYRTQKGFDKFKTIDYYHANGEDTGVPPQLIYDQLSGLLTVSGGQYRVTPDGIEN